MQNGQCQVRKMAGATEETWLLTKDAWGLARKWSEPGSTEFRWSLGEEKYKPETRKRAHNTENKFQKTVCTGQRGNTGLPRCVCISMVFLDQEYIGRKFHSHHLEAFLTN